jgi:hypothetical protein
MTSDSIQNLEDPRMGAKSKIQNHVEAIHATLPQVVIEFTGAGLQALAWLHSVGGSSRTVLEATDRYASASLTGLIGFTPVQFTSLDVARAMATKAFIRANHLAPSGIPVAGIGCTAAIATDRAKRGDHRACVVLCTREGVISYNLTLTKGARSRQEEEEVVSLMILRAVAQGCGLAELPELPLQADEQVEEQREETGLLERVVSGEFNFVVAWPDGRLTPGERLPGIALLSGSFNPLHDGHRHMAEVAARKLGQPVYFELPLVNADKAAIDPAEARRRVEQFAGQAPVILSRAPLFSQKAHFYPHSVFVLGLDTAARLVEPRFYNNNPAEMRAALQAIRTAGCRFLVAGRLVKDQFLTARDIAQPNRFHELFEEISETEFREDISSTMLRQKG